MTPGGPLKVPSLQVMEMNWQEHKREALVLLDKARQTPFLPNKQALATMSVAHATVALIMSQESVRFTYDRHPIDTDAPAEPTQVSQ